MHFFTWDDGATRSGPSVLFTPDLFHAWATPEEGERERENHAKLSSSRVSLATRGSA